MHQVGFIYKIIQYSFKQRIRNKSRIIITTLHNGYISFVIRQRKKKVKRCHYRPG